MRHWTLLQSSLFAGGILGLGALAGGRVAPFHLPEGVGFLSGKVAQAFESHYDAVFPAKTFGTNVWAAIDYVLFGEGRPGVVVGEQGWLYTDEEFKTYADAEAQIEKHLALIPAIRDALARNGTALVVAVVPAKARIYPEHWGRRRPARLHADLYGRALTVLRREGIASPELPAALIRCKQDQEVFLHTDTHWTPAGARCAAQSIGDAVHAAGLTGAIAVPYRTQTESVQPHRGDLFRYLPLDPYFKNLLPAEDRIPILRTDIEPGAAGATDLLGDGAPSQVVVVGTSYSADLRWNFIGALQEVLRQDVVSYAVEGKGPFIPMLDYLASADLQSAPPRLVIWEIPERYLPIGEDLEAYRLPPFLADPEPKRSHQRKHEGLP